MVTPHRYKVFALLSASARPDGRMQLTSQKIEDPRKPGTGALIFVVDDTALYRETIQAVLEEHGYQTLTANDGAAGLALFRAQGVDGVRAVVTDLDMPVMTGLQMLESIQQLEPQVRVICVSGSPAQLAKVPQVPGRVVALEKMAGMEALVACLESLLRD